MEGGRVDSYPGLLSMRTEEHSFAFHAEMNTRVERKRQACIRMSVTHCQTTLDHLSSLKVAAALGTAWSFGQGRAFLIHCHLPLTPQGGKNRKSLGWWNLLGALIKLKERTGLLVSELRLQDCEINHNDLMGRDKTTPEWAAWGLHTRTHGHGRKKDRWIKHTRKDRHRDYTGI